jgi:methylaspartate mutase epsilon subunit
LEKVQHGIEESYRTKKSTLNGYPYINQGVKNNRLLLESSGIPFSFNGGNDDDGRLASEIGMASGFTADIVHDLRDLICHGKHYPLDRRIRNNQYLCRLAAYYTDRGAPIEMDISSTISILAPPSLGIAIEILEFLTAAEQGIKHATLVYEAMGNIVQNVAGMQVLRKLAEEYLARFGYKDIVLSSFQYPLQYPFPRDFDQAAAINAWFCMSAILSGANRISVKSVEEASVTPSAKGNGVSCKIHKELINCFGNQRLPESEELKEERELIESETKAIIEKTLELGNGDPERGRVEAVKAGVIDAPFSPWLLLKGKVLPVWDRKDAVRWLDHGNLPFTKEMVRRNNDKIREREKAENRKADVEMIIEDLHRMAKPVVKQALMDM